MIRQVFSKQGHAVKYRMFIAAERERVASLAEPRDPPPAAPAAAHMGRGMGRGVLDLDSIERDSR